MHTAFNEQSPARNSKRRVPDFHFRRGEIARWFRSCAVCQTFLPPVDLLCPNCYRKLLSIAEPTEAFKRETGLPFPIRTLLEWTPQNDRVVKPLLHAFKGGTSFRVSRDLLLALVSEKSLQSPVFVPAPSSKKDHAFLLAATLAELFQCEAVLALEPVGDLRLQREKTRTERKTRQFQIKPNMVSLIAEIRKERRTIVFIDDVITTGATVLAAFEAFGRPRRFEAWSLARRPRLAGIGSF